MKQLSLFFFFLTLSLQAQFQLNGIVKESTTNSPLPFATITANNGANTISDVNGKFSILSKTRMNSFSTSYVGFYKSGFVVEKNKAFYTVLLSPKTDQLNEIVISTENPALAIIKKAIANKDSNNPQKKLDSFEFKSYNKLLVTANPDSIDGRIDSVFVEKTIGKQFSKIDSSNYKFKELVLKHHLFQTEKVSQYQFDNDKLKETILGTQMAGFKQPIYEIIAFNLQSFSVYDSKYELFEKDYDSPISKKSFKEYNFCLLDTVSIKDRKIYMIHFKSKKEGKISGLEGLLYIDQNNFAIAKAIVRLRGVLDISATHEFDYLPKENLWFPIQNTFKIVKGKNEDDINILVGTIKFDGDLKDFKSREKVASDFVYLLSKTNHFDIKYNSPIKIRKTAIAIEIKKDAINKPPIYWNKYRKDSLDLRSEKTYAALDSISAKKRVESKIRFGRKIINGYLPFNYIDLDLRKLFSYNNYEGFRLGLGGTTNERFSKKYKIEGYSAYGTKDDNFKYHLGVASRIDQFSNSWIGGSYTDDISEIASLVFAVDKTVFKIYDPRPVNISTFYKYVSWKTYFETKIIPKTESIWELSHTVVEPKFNYIYNLRDLLYNKYTMTTAMVSLQWNPFSDYMQTPTGRIETDKRFPKFTFQYTQSLPTILGNDFVFGKVDFKTEYEKEYLNGQKTNFVFQAGYAMGEVPLTHLYSTSPNNITKENIIQRITFSGRNSFETMFFNEFFSNQYALFQVKHSLDRIRLFKKIRPSLVFVSRMAWGNLKNPERHIGLEYKTLDKGFFESGIELNQIYKGLGLMAFYRYGPNQLPQFEDNIAVKISYILNLGF